VECNPRKNSLLKGDSKIDRIDTRKLATFRRKMIDFNQANRPVDIACSCLGIRLLPTSHLHSEVRKSAPYPRAARNRPSECCCQR